MMVRVNFNTTNTIRGLAKKKAKKQKQTLTSYLEDLIIKDNTEEKE